MKRAEGTAGGLCWRRLRRQVELLGAGPARPGPQPRPAEAAQIRPIVSWPPVIAAS